MSPEWYLSFGFGEFDKDMKEQELVEGCEEARLQLLNLRSQTAKVHYPNVGKHLLYHLFLFIIVSLSFTVLCYSMFRITLQVYSIH
jgi:hypothetical protein